VDDPDVEQQEEAVARRPFSLTSAGGQTAGSVTQLPAFRFTTNDTRTPACASMSISVPMLNRSILPRTRSLMRGSETPNSVAAAACVSPRASITLRISIMRSDRNFRCSAPTTVSELQVWAARKFVAAHGVTEPALRELVHMRASGSHHVQHAIGTARDHYDAAADIISPIVRRTWEAW